MSSKNNKTLTRLAEHILFEFNEKDVVDRFTLYDRPGPGSDDAPKEKVRTTVGSEVPLKPSVLMSTQNFGERPPVEDDEYVPTNRKELSNAASVISSMVPPDQVKFFYDGLHKLFTAAQDRDGSIDPEEEETSKPDNDEETEAMRDRKSRRANTDVQREGTKKIVDVLRRLIAEVSKEEVESALASMTPPALPARTKNYADYGHLNPNYEEAARKLQALGYNITADELRQNAARATPPPVGQAGYTPPAPAATKEPDRSWRAGAPAIDPRKSLNYMQNVLGYSSESGARQSAIVIKRRHDRMMALMDDPDAAGSLDDLREVLKDDLFDVLLKKKLVSPESAEAWKSHPDELGLYEHPAFRTLVGLVLDPFHKEEEKAIQSSIRTAMSKVKVKSPDTGKTIGINLSGPVSDTLFNQVVGGSDPDFDYVQKRLIAKDGRTPAEAAALAAAIRKAFLKVRKDVGLDTESEDFQGEDIISSALDDWMKKSDKDKEKLVMKVSDSLKDDQAMYKRERDYISAAGLSASPAESAPGVDAPPYEPPPPGSSSLSGWARKGEQDKLRQQRAVLGRAGVKAREEAEIARRRAEQGLAPNAPADRSRGRPKKEVPAAAPEVTAAKPADRVTPMRRKKA